MQVQCVCGSTLEIDQGAVGKVIQCPVCKANLAVQSPTAAAPAAAAPIPVTPYAAPDAGGGTMHRSYGKGVAVTFGFLLLAVYFVPWAISTQPTTQAFFSWDFLKIGTDEGKIVGGVWIGLAAFGLLSFILGIALRRIALGTVSFLLGTAAVVMLFYIDRTAYITDYITLYTANPLGVNNFEIGLVILHLGVILALFAVRLRGLCWREPIITRLLILVGLAPLVVGVLLPLVPNEMGVITILDNIGDTPLAGLYAGAAAATLFALLAMIPGSGGAAMAGLSYTFLILGMLYAPMRIFIDGMRSLLDQAKDAAATTGNASINIENFTGLTLPLLHLTIAALAVMLLTSTGLVGIVGSLISKSAESEATAK